MMHPPDLENDRVIATASGVGSVAVGRGTYWDDTTVFMAFLPSETVTIGRYCSIAAEAFVGTGGEHVLDQASTWPFDNFLLEKPNPTRSYRRRADTTIGSDVWIGHGAHVVGTVGHGAVVGAGAVVRGTVPPYAIVIGNPARVLRQRFPPPICEALLAIAWWEWPAALVRERIELFHAPIETFVATFAGGADG